MGPRTSANGRRFDVSLRPALSKPYYVLSNAQRRVWIEHRLHPDSLFYNISHIYDISGELDVPLFRASLERVVQRHEILRTNFAEINGQPVQIVHENKAMLEFHDVSMLDLQVQHRFEAQIVEQETNTPFDLADDCLIRTTLIKKEHNQYIFVLVMHHIIADRWSMDIFYKELSSIYNAGRMGTPIDLRPITIQYKDYAEWEQTTFKEALQQDHEMYWIRELQRGLTPVDLPFDERRPATPTTNGRIERIMIERGVLDQIKVLAADNGATLFMVLFATFNVFLAKISGQTDLVVGTFLASRQRKELLHMIGILFNNLPIRSDLSGDPTFEQLIDRTRGKVLEAFAHMHYSFDALIAELPVSRQGNRASLYNITFQLYYPREHDLILDAVSIGKKRIVQDTIHDLMCSAQESRRGLEVWFNYNATLFDPATMKRFLSHFRTLLNNIAMTPKARLSQLSLLSTAEQHQLIVTFNESAAPFPESATLIALFEAQVAATSTQSAVTLSGRDGTSQGLTYRDLNHRVAQLSAFLRQEGVSAGLVVGLLLERSIELVIACLAILKAGGTCLLINPSYPRERIRYMLKDARAQVVVTTSGVQSSRFVNKHIRRVDVHDRRIDAKDVATHLTDGTAIDPAFIIYTSGSTGKPKGVLLTQRGIVNQVFHRKRLLRITPDDTLCLSLSTGFVTCPLQIFTALLSGSRLLVYEEPVVKDPLTLLRLVARDQVKVVEVTVSMLRFYLQRIAECDMQEPDLRTLQTLLVAGEKLRPDTAQTFLERYPGIELMNAYGQTECSGMTLSGVVESKQKLTHVSEGAPTSNNQVFLLDSHRQVVPIGVRGDIYVSGEGLALGYLNKPILTAEAFLPHPFRHGKQIYRTGDIGRMLPDGRIEVLGRRDEQVKIRGNRIELGEIEAQLQLVQEIKASYVIANEDAQGECYLIAYYVADRNIDRSVFRLHLKRNLPEVMIPRHFVRIEHIPVGINGKVDRQALPAPSVVQQAPTEDTEANTEIEAVVADIWRNILSIQTLGMSQNFFELGGNSLQAVHVVAVIHERTCVELPPDVLFDYPTIRELAAEVDRQR